MPQANEAQRIGEGGWSFLGRLDRALAFSGGALTLFIAGFVTASVLSSWLAGSPIPDENDYVGIMTSIAVFAFMPYCQFRRAHVAVDTFTNRLPRALQRRIDAVWDLVYAAIMAVLTYCLVLGVIDKYGTAETAAPNIAVPSKWSVIMVVAVLAGLLAMTALATAVERMRSRG